jgi:hypothetical protein
VTARVRARVLLRPELWAGLWLATSLVLILFPSATDVALSKVWMWLTALTLSSLLVFALRTTHGEHDASWTSRVAVVLPRTERDNWVAEAHAVLAAAQPGAERRGQAWGYLRSLPVTVTTTWSLHLRQQWRSRRTRP